MHVVVTKDYDEVFESELEINKLFTFLSLWYHNTNSLNCRIEYHYSMCLTRYIAQSLFLKHQFSEEYYTGERDVRSPSARRSSPSARRQFAAPSRGLCAAAHSRSMSLSHAFARARNTSNQIFSVEFYLQNIGLRCISPRHNKNYL